MLIEQLPTSVEEFVIPSPLQGLVPRRRARMHADRGARLRRADAQRAEVRFLVGFALITVAFPFGRNVALATFSKVLGPCDQGEWELERESRGEASTAGTWSVQPLTGAGKQ